MVHSGQTVLVRKPPSVLVQVWLVLATTTGNTFPHLLNRGNGFGKSVILQMRCAVKNKQDIVPGDFASVQEIRSSGAEIPAAMTVGHHVHHALGSVTGSCVYPLPVMQRL